MAVSHTQSINPKQLILVLIFCCLLSTAIATERRLIMYLVTSVCSIISCKQLRYPKNCLIDQCKIHNTHSSHAILETINFRCRLLSRWLIFSQFSFWNGRSGAPGEWITTASLQVGLVNEHVMTYRPFRKPIHELGYIIHAFSLLIKLSRRSEISWSG